jgi:N-glycosylase/DNA lyase
MKVSDITEYDKAMAKIVINEFKREKTDEQIFYDLCFALLAPQTTYINNRKVSNKLWKADFYNKNIPLEELEEIVRAARFFRNKSRYLLEAKKKFRYVLMCIESSADSHRKRDFLVKNIRGLGMKAASHFLRNLGHTDLALIDTHVLKFLSDQIPKNKKEYIEIENKLINISNKIGTSIAEIDAIIWKHYSDTAWEEFVY